MLWHNSTILLSLSNNFVVMIKTTVRKNEMIEGNSKIIKFNEEYYGF